MIECVGFPDVGDAGAAGWWLCSTLSLGLVATQPRNAAPNLSHQHRPLPAAPSNLCEGQQLCVVLGLGTAQHAWRAGVGRRERCVGGVHLGQQRLKAGTAQGSRQLQPPPGDAPRKGIRGDGCVRRAHLLAGPRLVDWLVAIAPRVGVGATVGLGLQWGRALGLGARHGQTLRARAGSVFAFEPRTCPAAASLTAVQVRRWRRSRDSATVLRAKCGGGRGAGGRGGGASGGSMKACARLPQAVPSRGCNTDSLARVGWARHPRLGAATVIGAHIPARTCAVAAKPRPLPQPVPAARAGGRGGRGAGGGSVRSRTLRERRCCGQWRFR